MATLHFTKREINSPPDPVNLPIYFLYPLLLTVNEFLGLTVNEFLGLTVNEFLGLTVNEFLGCSIKTTKLTF